MATMKKLAVCLAFCALAQNAGAEYNVILVVLDTVRADHTSIHGYARDTTPRMKEFALKGTVFETALAQSDWTIPAFASMFTGKRPQSHGTFMQRDRLDSSEATMAQIFDAHGFQTAAFVTLVMGVPFFNINQGFQKYRRARSNSLRDSMQDAADWLTGHHRQRFLLMVHGADAHYPYGCPKGYIDRYASGYEGVGKDRIVDHRFLIAFNRKKSFWKSMSLRDLSEIQAIKTDPRAMAHLMAQYDGCLSYADSQLGVLFETLNRLDLWRNTIVIVTADHGEELGDHGEFGHVSAPLYEEIIHIPFVMYVPDQARWAGMRIKEPVEQIDLLPTLVDLEGWKPLEAVDGSSFKGLFDGLRRDRPYYGQAPRQRFNPKVLTLEAFRKDDWKVVRVDRRWKLFDLKRDPKEQDDLIQKRPDVFLKLSHEVLGLK